MSDDPSTPPRKRAPEAETMSTTTELIQGVDFMSVPCHDLDVAVAFYGTTLGLPMSAHVPDRGFAEFETGNLTLSVIVPEKMGMTFRANPNPLALHVEDVEQARGVLEE